MKKSGNFPEQKKQKGPPPYRRRAHRLFQLEIFFGNPAIRATHSRGDLGPAALRRRISPGLPLSEAIYLKNNVFPS